LLAEVLDRAEIARCADVLGSELVQRIRVVVYAILADFGYHVADGRLDRREGFLATPAQLLLGSQLPAYALPQLRRLNGAAKIREVESALRSDRIAVTLGNDRHTRAVGTHLPLVLG